MNKQKIMISPSTSNNNSTRHKHRVTSDYLRCWTLSNSQFTQLLQPVKYGHPISLKWCNQHHKSFQLANYKFKNTSTQTWSINSHQSKLLCSQILTNLKIGSFWQILLSLHRAGVPQAWLRTCRLFSKLALIKCFLPSKFSSEKAYKYSTLLLLIWLIENKWLRRFNYTSITIKTKEVEWQEKYATLLWSRRLHFFHLWFTRYF